MIDDYLVAEDLLINHLMAQVSSFKTVLGAADLSGVAENKQITPAGHVVYGGDRLGSDAGRHESQFVYQKWLVVIAVKNVRDQKTGAGARREAGPLITASLKALQGWSPGDEFQPLKRVGAPSPHFSPGGYAYFPLAFETRIIAAAGP